MPTTTKLQSRLPEIIAEMEVTLPVALRAGAEAIAEDAKGRVPVRTGALRDAIHVEHLPARGDLPEAEQVIAGDGGDVFYGHIVEHGSAANNVPPHPFLIPAFEAQAAGIELLLAEALRRL